MESELSSVGSYELIHDFINRVIESANRAELEKMQDKVSVYHARREKEREELMKAIGTGHGYTSGGVIERSDNNEQSNIQAD